ncbi:hypothetical protein GXM_06409 [Nostoc sphaeroides CCNUC1]|uniref:Uncharacterized protein n=1 Tax=Nostoc sphaeroides CCNUC1 TaxID=2653204 RepID=A0A5P8W823_9NOSO|nr:hypothetical protein GXM_06409 [Nostoc sphaeroides CCNUC1]
MVNTVQLRIFGTDFRPVETRNFASLPRFLGLTERYWLNGHQSTVNSHQVNVQYYLRNSLDNGDKENNLLQMTNDK